MSLWSFWKSTFWYLVFTVTQLETYEIKEPFVQVYLSIHLDQLNSFCISFRFVLFFYQFGDSHNDCEFWMCTQNAIKAKRFGPVHSAISCGRERYTEKRLEIKVAMNKEKMAHCVHRNFFVCLFVLCPFNLSLLFYYMDCFFFAVLALCVIVQF